MDTEVITACANVCRDFNWVGPLTEWIGNMAIPVGVGIAWYQLSMWRKEHLAKRKSETALQLLSRVQSVSRALSATRSMFESVPTDAKDRSDAVIEIKWKRLQSYDDEFEDLRTLQVLCEALLGNASVVDAVNKLFDVRQEIFASLDTLHGWKLHPDSSQEDIEFKRKLDRQISSQGSKKDELSTTVKDAVDLLKKELIPVIRMSPR